jgi:hypothetical protein
MMSYQHRQESIQRLEQIRGSRVLSYVLSDRESFPPGIPGLSAQIAGEPQLLFIEQLRTIGRCENLDLLLYTRGGATDAVWPLVNLLREYSDRLTVLVPFRAHSAGTLICLGADEIVMTEFAELSPIDPTTGNQFNPTDPTNPQNRFGISVEDVAAYFALCEQRGGVTQEPYKTEVLKELTNKVHPLALGNVQRVYMQIRQLARKLLALHLDVQVDSLKMDEIIKALTEQFYSHVHAICYREANELMGDWVRKPTDEEATIMWELFQDYVQSLQLDKKLNLPVVVGDEPVSPLSITGAIIESSESSYTYTTEMTVIQRPNLPPNVQVQMQPDARMPLSPDFARSFDFRVMQMGWIANTEGV